MLDLIKSSIFFSIFVKQKFMLMRVAIIGAGNMGSAIAGALVASGNYADGDIICANPSPGKLERLREMWPQIATTQDNCLAVDGADVVVVAVKPWLAERVVGQIANVFDPSRQVLLSVMAGVGYDEIRGWLLGNVVVADDITPAVGLLIPNTAISVAEGVTFLTPYNFADSQLSAVVDMFSVMGDVVIVDEKHLQAGTILSSCGIAFALRYARAAAEGGVELGFKAEEATRIVAQTMKGAAELLLQNNSHPEAEIDRVTTPGGITIRGLNAMEDAGFTSAVISGLRACKK